MCIRNYNSMLMDIKKKLKNNELKYKNTIIVGDNSSGKSEILREILRDTGKEYYFIDSVNRTFDYKLIDKKNGDMLNTYKSVVESRLKDNIFNLKDSFDINKTGIGFCEEIYFNFESQLKKMIKDFLGIELSIIEENNIILGKTYKLNINNMEKLSSGYQAIIRIFLEILYFQNSLINKDYECIVVIDEINEFLSTKNEGLILPFLMENFNDFNFIVTTHSADVIANSNDCNIIVLNSENYQYLDGNDFDTVTDVREIFDKIYNIDESNKIKDIEVTLRNLLNYKIQEQWTQNEEEKLNNINEKQLTNAQKLILKQIKSW